MTCKTKVKDLTSEEKVKDFLANDYHTVEFFEYSKYMHIIAA